MEGKIWHDASSGIIPDRQGRPRVFGGCQRSCDTFEETQEEGKKTGGRSRCQDKE